jgi:lipooligosaccharide transport system ATP-binding protein
VLWDRLYRLKEDGVTLLLTTHYMDEAEQLCDRLMIIDQGRIVAQGTPQELIAAHVTREVLEVRFALDVREAAGVKLRGSALGGDGSAGGPRVELLPDRVLVYADDGEGVLAAVHAMSLVPVTALVRRATLEDVFLKLTGRSLAD